MAQLRQDYESFKNLDTEVLAVGPENTKAFQEYWTKENLPFVGLPDPKHTLSGLYGQEIKILKLGRLPCQMIIDKTGILRFVFLANILKKVLKHEILIIPAQIKVLSMQLISRII